MYRLVVAPRARKGLKEIKGIHQEAVDIALEELREFPLAGKVLGRELTGKFSLRVGVYRIIYKVNSRDRIVNILNAGHRSVVYQ